MSVVIGALAVGAWLWGPLSDRIGRRASLVLASALLVVPSLLAAVAPTFGLLLGGARAPGTVHAGAADRRRALRDRGLQRADRGAGDGLLRLVAGRRRPRRARRRRAADRRRRLALGARGGRAAAARRHARDAPLAARPSRRCPPRRASRRGRSPGCCATARSSRPRSPGARRSARSWGSSATSTSAWRIRRSRSRRRSSGSSSCSGSWAPPGRRRAASRGACGWRPVAAGALAIAASGLTLSLVPVLAVVIVGLALVTLGQLLVRDGRAARRRLAPPIATAAWRARCTSASTTSPARSAATCPGLAWEAWGWTGVWALAVGAQLTGMAAIAATRSRAGAR